MSNRFACVLFTIAFVFAFSGMTWADNVSKDGLNPVSFANPNAPFANEVDDARPATAEFKKPMDQGPLEAQMTGATQTPPGMYFCDIQSYYDDTATSVWVWSIPDAWGDDLFNMRFTVEQGIQCTLKVGYVLMYGGWATGTPDMRVYLWDDDGFGFPGNKLDSVDVPNASMGGGFWWASADWSMADWVFDEGEEYHIGWTTLGGDGDTLWGVSDKGTGPHSYSDEQRASENWNGFWGTMYDDWDEDVCFLIESEHCCYEMPYTDCYSQSWDEGTAYFWKSPHDSYNIIDYAQRFTVSGVETLTSVDIDVYDFTGSSSQNAGIAGNDDLIISIWDDDGTGYPGSVIAQETVPAGTYPFYPSATNVDFSSHNLVLSHGNFYVSFNSSGSVAAGDFEATLSDDESDGHGRSYCIYQGSWSTIGDLFNVDVDMKFTANLCIDPFTNCYIKSYYIAPEYYWSLPDQYGDVANAQLIRPYGSHCRVEEVSWALHLPASDSLNNPYTYDSKVSVYSDIGGQPGVELASITLTPANYVMFPGWTTVDFTSQYVIVSGRYWIAIESFAPTPEEGIRTLTDFGGGSLDNAAAEMWNGMWGLLCEGWSGVPCDIAFVAESRICCDIPPPTQCYGDPAWSTAQHDQQRTGKAGSGFGDAQCDLNVAWGYTHPTNQIFYTGPAIYDGKVACAWDNEVKVFNLTTGLEAYTISGFPLGNQIRCTPHIQDGVMYLSGGDQQSTSAWDFATGAMIWSRDISTGIGQVFGQTRYGSFIILDQSGTEVLYFGTDDGAIVAVDAATGALYAGWASNPVYLSYPPKRSGSTDGASLFYNTSAAGFDGDVYSIDGATGAINWQLSGVGGGLQAGAIYPEGPQIGEAFPAGNAVDLETGALFVVSDIYDPTFPGDGVLYSIDVSDGSLNYAVPSVGYFAAYSAIGGAAGPIVDRARIYVAGASHYNTSPTGGTLLGFVKSTGALAWATQSPETNRYFGEIALTCEPDGAPDILINFGHHGFIDFRNSVTGDEIFRRRITYGGFPNSIALSAAIGPGYIAISDLYGSLAVLAKGEDRPRLELQSYQVEVPVEFGDATSLHVPLEGQIVNTGCVDLTINTITIDDAPNHPWIPPDFSPTQVRPDVMDRAASITNRLIESFNAKAVAAKKDADVDDYFLMRDRGEQTMNLGANAIPDFIQTATHPSGVVSPADGSTIAAGDTVDVVIDVNQSLILRGPQDFYMVFDTDDPDFYLHDGWGVNLYGPPEIHVTIIGGCLIDTTTMQFGMGGGNTQLVTNTGRIATGDWDPHGFDIDGDDASVYQGSFIYATGVYEQAINTQDWRSGGGEAEAYRSLQPDPNWCDNECKAHLDEGVVLSCLGGYSSDGMTYTPIMGNRVCKSYLDSVQSFYNPSTGGWEWDWWIAPFDDDLTMGLYVNTRTVGAVGFAPLKDLTIEIFEITERNGDSVTGWKFGATMDYDIGSDDIASRSEEGSAAWVSNGGVGDTQWGMIKFPFGCGSTAPVGGNNTNVDYVPLINTVSGHGYGMWWDLIYLGDSAWTWLNRPAGEYSQDVLTSDREAHFTIAGHDFAGGDTYEMAVAQFGLHGTSGTDAEVVALAKLANQWLGFGRGDVNNDGVIDMADVVYLAMYVNGFGPGPIPFMHLGDVDVDGDVDLNDAIYLAEYLYNNGDCPGGDWCF